MIRVLHPVPAEAPHTLRLERGRTHYLLRVLRLQVGDTFEVFDGQGRSFAARLVDANEQGAEVALGPATATRMPRRITVVQGMPKADKLEWVLQKGTELGASAFAPAFTEHSVVKPVADKTAEKTVRWQRIVEEAARQCGRSDVPTVLPSGTLASAMDGLEQGTCVLVLDEQERTHRLSDAVRAAEQAPLALVVGPEGGLSRAEVETLKAKGAHPVTLGGRILRTETAAMAALAVIRHLDGELG